MKKLIVLGLLVLALFAAPAQAKPVHAAGSISLNEAPPIAIGQIVTFSYVLPSGLKDCKNGNIYNCAMIRLDCVQNGTLVYHNAIQGVGNWFPLVSNVSPPVTWNQPSSCIAVLFEWPHSGIPVDYTSVAFNVS